MWEFWAIYVLLRGTYCRPVINLLLVISQLVGGKLTIKFNDVYPQLIAYRVFALVK